MKGAAEFRILGPLEIVMADRVVPLGGPRQRAVLGMLLVHRNEVVSADRLVDAVWGAAPPATVAKALQMQVSILRKAIGSDRIETRGGGYVLRLVDGEVDADRFDAIVASTRGRVLEERSEMLRGALAVWRGPPLDDLAYEAFAAPEIRRLNERKLTVVEDLIDVELRLGRHLEVVSELEGLVRQEPLRERLAEQLMVSLYRSGRQADALEVGRRTRRLLADQLGIEPSRSLRELERAVLNQDPSLDPPPVEGRRRPATPVRAALIGRATELAVLLDALDDATAGHGRLVLVGGEPGIGKSRLVEEFASEAGMRHARVLVGRCWEVGGAPAYWPWVQLLRSYLREQSPDEVRVQMGPAAQDLVQVLPELYDLIPALEPAPVDSEGARFRLFDSAATFLRNAGRQQPLVVVLEDVQAADESSLLLLRFLARDLSASRLVLVAAYRTVDPTPSDRLSETLAELAREPAATTVILDGLGEDDVSRLIEQTTTEVPPPVLAATLHADTDGNPLFVAEIARLMAAEGRLSGVERDHRTIPESVYAAIRRRLRRLSAECNRILVLAAVLGREFRLDALEQVAHVDRDRLIDVLDEALVARVLVELPASPGSLGFGHALVRDVAYESISGPRRAVIHRQVAEALERLYNAEPEPPLAELAHHFFLAASDGDTGRAVRYCRLAGQRAADLLAYEEAARLYLMALELLDRARAGRVAEHCELLLALGDAQARAGDALASKQTFRAAAELARSNDLPELLGQAALGYGGRMVWDVSRDDQQLLSLLEGALAALGADDAPLRARLLARLAGGPLRDSRFPRERREALGDEAIAIARRLGDVPTLAYALGGHIASHQGPDFTARQAVLSAELVDLALSVGDRERAIEGLELRFASLLELGDMPGALEALAHLDVLARELRQPSQMWYSAAYRAVVLLLEGRLAEAEQLIEDALRLGERSQNWSATVSYRLQLYLLRREQGRVAELRDMVTRSAAEYPTYPIWRCVLAQTGADLGPDHDARALLRALVSDDLTALPFDEEWLVCLGLLSEAARALDDAEAGGAIYPRLLPYADRVAVAYPEISLGSVSRYLGLLAATLEQWDAGAGHFAAAIAVNGRIGARPWRAYAQLDLARMLLEHGRARDRTTVRQLAGEAADAGRALGMDALVAAAAALG